MDPVALHSLIDTVWLKRHKYLKAETLLSSPEAKAPTVTSTCAVELLGELTAMRKEIEETLKGCNSTGGGGDLSNRVLKVESACREMMQTIGSLKESISQLHCKVDKLALSGQTTSKKEADDEIDLFASDDEPEDKEKEKIRQQRLQAYEAKKAKKPAAVAKSSVILDVKPWDDETDMKQLEEQVRSITMDGLVWGASKLVPVGYGIKKLQIMCVVEDEKVSIDALNEQIEGFEDYVQSVDIAAFNKI